MNNNHDQSAALMWPVRGDDPELHVTVLYLGKELALRISPEKYLKILGELTDAPGEIAVTGVEVFGEDEKVWVATLDASALAPLREQIKFQAEDTFGFEDASSFPDYRPHVTLGPADDETTPPAAPATFQLGRLEFWIGGAHYRL